jgi:hypothetical protein
VSGVGRVSGKSEAILTSADRGHYIRGVAEIPIMTSDGGRAYLKLGDGEVRDSVELGTHDEADRIPTLDSLVLHFDFYGRLTAIEVTDSAPSVLPPGLLED